MFLVASVGGPILGGVFAEQLSWRLVFYINVPLGIVSFYLLARYLHVDQRRTEHKIDYAGAILLVGRDHVLRAHDELGWHPSRVGLAHDRRPRRSRRWCSAIAFMLRERTRRGAGDPRPDVPHRAARLASGINFTTGLAFWPALYFTAAFLQYVRGVDPGVAGVYVAPFMVGAVGGNLISGRRIGQTGRYRTWPIAGGVARDRSAR